MKEKEVLFYNKKFDEETLKYLNNFIYEFNELFGKYLSKEEVIERIDNYLEEIEFSDDTDGEMKKRKALGYYNTKEHKIKIRNDISNEQKASTFFHEMVHVLRQKLKDEFKKQENDDFYEFMMTSAPLMGFINVGTDEGFTQWLTQKRNERFTSEVQNSYPILTKQFNNLAEIVGEEEIIPCMLKDLDSTYNLVEEKFNWEDEDFFDFDKDMEIIWKYEKSIYDLQGSAEKALLFKIFGVQLPKNVRVAQTNIIRRYLKQKTTNIEEYKKMLEHISGYVKDLNADMNGEIFEALYDEYERHPEYNIKEEIPELYEEFKKFDIINEFCDKEFEEQISILSKDQEFVQMIETYKYGDVFRKKIVESFVQENDGLKQFKENDHDSMYYLLTTGNLATKIKNGDIDLSTLAIEWIDTNCNGLYSCNLYSANGIEDKYIGTYSVGEELTEFNVEQLSNQEIKKILSYSDNQLNENCIFFKAKDPKVTDMMCCTPEGRWFFIGQYKDNKETTYEISEICDKTVYFPSNIEDKVHSYFHFKTKMSKHFKNVDMYQNILENQKRELLKELKLVGIIDKTIDEEIDKKEDNLTENSLITPEDIEEEAQRQKVSIFDMDKLVLEIEKRLQGKLERGNIFIDTIGGDEIGE